MKESRMVSLLGRPLTTVEHDNYKLYLKIAEQILGGLLCSPLCDEDDPKVYGARDGMRTVFTAIFTSLEEVKVDGEVVDPSKYSARQWDLRSAPWYNSIVFTDKLDLEAEVEVTAVWGFQNTPKDLQLVLAGLFGLIGSKQRIDATIQSKKVEDFQVTFRANVDLNADFETKYASTIAKYSLCDEINTREGSIC